MADRPPAEPAARTGSAPPWLIALGALLCAFTLAEVNYPHLTPKAQLAVFALFGLVLCFWLRPLGHPVRSAPGREGGVSPARRRAGRAVDLLLTAAAVVVCGYVVVQTEPRLESWWLAGQALGNRAGQETPLDVWIGLVGLVLVIEAARRTVGLTLPLLALVFLVYAYSGPSLPDWLLPHRGYTLDRIAAQAFLQAQGVFGVALGVMFTYVFLFVVFGAFLEATGATGFVIRFARRLFHSSPGGPAKVAVLSSGLMGSLSGSAVANTATTGTFTIPLMKSSGFPSHVAGGIEAAASSGGALMPPVMGAGAYMMLEIVDPPVTYLQILQAALLPALLYYLSLFLIVHFYSRRVDARRLDAVAVPAAAPAPGLATDNGGDPDDDGSLLWRLLEPEGLLFFAALGSLIVFLLLGFTAFRAVSLSLLVVVAGGALHRRTRLSWRSIGNALAKSARDSVPLICAAACVGIVIGIVTLTGVGTRLPGLVLPLAQESLPLALALIMVSSIVLGMGLPSAVCYLLMATLMGSVLSNLGVVPLAAHLFIFYFGMMSMVTPPVALAAYAAGSIAGSNILRTGVAAFRFALVGFTLPYLFVFRPALLMMDPEAGAFGVIASLAIAVAGVVAFAAGISGFFFAPLTGWQRAALLASAALFLVPAGEVAGQNALVLAAGTALLVLADWSSRRASRAR